MTQVNRDYELTMLTIAIDMYLDKTIAFTEEGLQLLESNRDRFVWELSTNIYIQSGHKVEFYIARDGVNSWLENKKKQLSELRLAEEEKARQIIAEEIRLVAEEKHRITENNARLAAEHEAHIFSRTLLLEEIDKFAEQIVEAKRNENELDYVIEHLGTSKAGIFFRLQRVIVEQLSIEENLVHLDTSIDIWSDLYANNRRSSSSSRSDLTGNSFNFFGMSISSYSDSNDDYVELMMAIEEEFDIEIPDEVAEQIGTVEKTVDYLYNKLST